MRIRTVAVACMVMVVAAVACTGKTTSPYFSGLSPVTVLDTTPASASSGAALSATIQAEFSESLSTSGVASGSTSAAFQVFRETTASAPLPGTYAFSTNDRILTFTPAALLSTASTYVAAISAGYPDFLGRPLGPFQWSFTTAPFLQSKLLQLIPAVGEVAIPTNFQLRAAFSQPLSPASAIAVRATVSTTNGGTQLIQAAYDAGTNSLFFQPQADFPAASTISVAVNASNLTDVSGHKVATAGLAGWTFTTGSSPDTLPPVQGPVFNAVEQPPGTGHVQLPPISGVWRPADIRWEATFVQSIPPPKGCLDPYTPALHRVAVLGSGNVISAPGLANGPWSVSVVAVDGSGNASPPSSTRTFAITTGTVTFAADIKPILQSTCALVGCHLGNEPPGYMNLSTSQTLAQIVGYHPHDPAKPLAVTPSCLSSSYLWWKIAPGFDIDGSLMPPDFVDTPALSGPDLATFQAWIEQGAN